MMGFPFNNSTMNRMDIIERMEQHMGEGAVKRAEHYLDKDWNGSEEEIPAALLEDLRDVLR